MDSSETETKFGGSQEKRKKQQKCRRPREKGGTVMAMCQKPVKRLENEEKKELTVIMRRTNQYQLSDLVNKVIRSYQVLCKNFHRY